MTENAEQPIRGFVPKAEREDINISPIHPLREAALLVGGVVGGALAIFLALALAVEFLAPMVPPRAEVLLFGWWGDILEGSMDDEARRQAEEAQVLLNTLLEHWRESPYPVTIVVDDAPEINAFAIPAGTIVLTTGLLEAVGSDEELAFVIGHELGHFASRDQMRGLGRGLSLGLLAITLGSSGVGKPALTLVDQVDQAAERTMNRNQEREADEFGLELLIAAYGTTQGARDFFAHLQDRNPTEDLPWANYLSTHPSNQDRLHAIPAD